jgi:hypothetical protein
MATALGPITVHHVHVCPFSQLLAKSRGGTALSILETLSWQILKVSLIHLQYLEEYLEDVFPGPVVAESDPYRRAVEGPMARMEADGGLQGYRFVFQPDWHLRPWPSKQKYGSKASDAELGF